MRAMLSGAMTQLCVPVIEPKCARIHGRSSLSERHHAEGRAEEHGEFLKWWYTIGDLAAGDFLMTRVGCHLADPGDELLVMEPRNGNDYLADCAAGHPFHVKPRTPLWLAAKECTDDAWRLESRLTLTVTRVRAIRLQDISGDDMMAHGIRENGSAWAGGWKNDVDTDRGFHSIEDAFSDFWDPAHPEHEWAANPWVWVLDFEAWKKVRVAGPVVVLGQKKVASPPSSQGMTFLTIQRQLLSTLQNEWVGLAESTEEVDAVDFAAMLPLLRKAFADAQRSGWAFDEYKALRAALTPAQRAAVEDNNKGESK